MSALNRVKEQITPELSSKDRLRTMLVTLQDASHLCQDEPDILYYRSIVADRLGDKRDAEYAKSKLPDNFQPNYNPFSSPPAAAAPAGPPPRVARKWALVVGINQFSNSQVTPLKFAVKDSTDFAEYLTDSKGGRFQADRMKCLADDKATLVGVREGLGWLRANVQAADLVVIYISSHGSPRDMDPNGVSYVIMHDTDPSNSAKLYATSLQMIDLVQQLNREIKARRVVLFLDTCYSGDASGSGRNKYDGTRRLSPVPDSSPASSAFSAALQNLKVGEGRAVITASRADEESWEDPRFHNGYFTHYLIEALREKDGAQTLGDVFPKVRDEVLTSVRNDHEGKTQTPSCEFSERASTIVIGVPEGQ
jgi:uncharacterized caspase-like protein